ncbi:hypothetical protein D917_04146, partial [Trichinella nativa]
MKIATTSLLINMVTVVVVVTIAGNADQQLTNTTAQGSLNLTDEGALQELKIFANPAEAETQCDDIA